MSIRSQLSDVRETLPEGVTLVAVSKTHAPALIEEAYAAGQRIFGESRPQELAAKYEALPKDIEWHMIGHLQTNKVKLIAPFVALIHSADSERLIRVINDEAIRNGRVIDILLEIHVADEETKSGWTYDALLKYVKSGALAAMKGVRVRGVMGIATYTSNEFRVRLDFELLQQYKKELEAYFDSSFDTLSMGMSDDYPLALDYGTTMVRIGSLIFGKRDYAAAEKEATVRIPTADTENPPLPQRSRQGRIRENGAAYFQKHLSYQDHFSGSLRHRKAMPAVRRHPMRRTATRQGSCILPPSANSRCNCKIQWIFTKNQSLSSPCRTAHAIGAISSHRCFERSTQPLRRNVTPSCSNNSRWASHPGASLPLLFTTR